MPVKKKTKAPKGDQNRSVCWDCGREWDDSWLRTIADFWDRVKPGEICPSGECPKCGSLCTPLETAETPYKKVLTSLLDTVKATGGLVLYPNGTVAPAGDPDWIDLGEVIQEARKLIPFDMEETNEEA
ncbi:MAG: hypothetical protein ACRDHZ_24965 [Ktedonobacteraceae bacterium]